MKILAIGNSFSTDSTRYLEEIALSNNEEFKVWNLYIGGCSLEQHLDNFKTGAPNYSLEERDNILRPISLQEAILSDNWDYITIQQASHYSGQISTYEPFIGEIINYIKDLAPKSKIVFNRTWAYEIDSDHGAFPWYDKDQEKMFKAILDATNIITLKYNLPIIPVGDNVEKVRRTKEFDYRNGGLSLNRDGFHLSFDYGRYLAGLTWYKFFSEKETINPTFKPSGTNEELIKVIKEVVLK